MKQLDYIKEKWGGDFCPGREHAEDVFSNMEGLKKQIQEAESPCMIFYFDVNYTDDKAFKIHSYPII